MLKLHSLTVPRNSKHKKKVVGRGVGSGHGRTSTRGSKGQKARSGDGTKRSYFEGGQTPLVRRIPKRGFASHKRQYRKRCKIINIQSLNKFTAGSKVTILTLKQKGLLAKSSKHIKILGNGELKVPLSVKINKLSKSALAKITKNSL
ncbi:MAG: 50S ribosomal protein L15 [Endomicrobium sp.]|jgi:large subunit ribosomal protein L15|nr:50S ribosomal protein L15 [Endomicrobium sp.]